MTSITAILMFLIVTITGHCGSEAFIAAVILQIILCTIVVIAFVYRPLAIMLSQKKVSRSLQFRFQKNLVVGTVLFVLVLFLFVPIQLPIWPALITSIIASRLVTGIHTSLFGLDFGISKVKEHYNILKYIFTHIGNTSVLNPHDLEDRYFRSLWKMRHNKDHRKDRQDFEVYDEIINTPWKKEYILRKIKEITFTLIYPNISVTVAFVTFSNTLLYLLIKTRPKFDISYILPSIKFSALKIISLTWMSVLTGYAVNLTILGTAISCLLALSVNSYTRESGNEPVINDKELDRIEKHSETYGKYYFLKDLVAFIGVFGLGLHAYVVLVDVAMSTGSFPSCE